MRDGESMEYIVTKFYDALNEFVSSFSLVSGRAHIRVLAISFVYFAISVIGEVSGGKVIVKPMSAFIAMVVIALACCVSKVQASSIRKLREYLKGDGDNK